MEFFTGKMAYLHSGHAQFPLLLGHEWAGTVISVGDEVDSSWIGKRVTGDTMLGCGQCARCLGGLQHVCHDRSEIGIRNGRPGALAEEIAVPISHLHLLPESMDMALGALVEPGGNAWRSVDAAQLSEGDSVLVIGAGTIGLLCAMIAKAEGADVHILGRSERSLNFAGTLGFLKVYSASNPPTQLFDAVIEASNSVSAPANAIKFCLPGKRVVYIGISEEPSLIDSRDLVLNDITAVGILSASPGLEATISLYASGRVDPRPLIAQTVGLEFAGQILSGAHLEGAGLGPKFHIDPRI